MLKLNITDMSCDHCVATIERAVTALDPTARVTTSLKAKSAVIVTSEEPARIEQAIRDAGFDVRRTA